jgi:hypothetical protein
VSDTHDLCTLADVKQAFETGGTSTARDPRISAAITAASMHIMAKLERELAPRSTGQVRVFRLPLDADRPIANLAPFDLRQATLLRLHPEDTSPITVLASQYALQPPHKPEGSYGRVQLADTATLQSTFSLQFGYAQLEITGDWGIWDTAQVPAHVREATAQTVRSWLRQGTSNSALAGLSGAAEGVQTEPPQTFGIPPGAWSAISYLKRSF